MLAEEIGIQSKQIYRVYIPEGCPHERTESRHILINGELFREWIKNTDKTSSMQKIVNKNLAKNSYSLENGWINRHIP